MLKNHRKKIIFAKKVPTNLQNVGLCFIIFENNEIIDGAFAVNDNIRE